MVTVVTEWDGAAVFTPILLNRNGLRRSLGVEFALKFCPDDRHAEESAAVWSGGVDLWVMQAKPMLCFRRSSRNEK
jgi:hypothetical protein